MWIRLVRTVGAASAMLAAGCSLVVDPDQVQCLIASDCAALGHPEMECVDSVCVQPEATTFSCMATDWPPLSTESVQISIEALSLGVETPVPGLTVNICNTLVDALCVTPVGQAATNANGVANLNVSEGFRGHFLVPSISAEQAPYILHMNPPPNAAEPSTLNANLTITNLQTIAGIAMLAGETFVPNRGHLFFSTRDCAGALLPGVRVSIADAASDVVVAYLGGNGNPDQNLDSTGANARGAVINLAPGFVTVRGSHDDVGKIFEQTLLISENTITSTQIVPSTF